MDGALLIFILTLITYIPLAWVLLYVWWKYGKGESGVSVARVIFLAGSCVLIFLLTLI
jgi:hypothetical protein